MSLRRLLTLSFLKSGLHLVHAFSAAAEREVQNMISKLIQPAAEYPDHWDYAEAPNIATAAETLGIDPIRLGKFLAPILMQESKHIFDVKADTLVMIYQAQIADIDTSATDPKLRTKALRAHLSTDLDDTRPNLGIVIPILDALRANTVDNDNFGPFEIGIGNTETPSGDMSPALQKLLIEVFIEHIRNKRGIRELAELNETDLANVASRIHEALGYETFQMPPVPRRAPKLTVAYSR